MLSGEIEGYSLDKRLFRPDGSIVWVYLVVAPLTLSHRQRFNHICLVQDITRRKAVEQALSESVRSKSVLLSHLPGMAYRCQYDRDWTMEYVSEGCLELTGYPTSSLIGNRDLSFNDLIAPEYREILWEKWKQVLAERKPFKDEYEIVTRAGVRKWVIEMGQGLFDSRGRIEALEGIILDISDRKEMEHALKYSNEHDAWTGLYNRRYLEETIGRELVRARRSGVSVGVILIDIDRFEQMIDRYGPDTGDRLLQALGTFLLQGVRAGDLACRYGNEDFLLVLPQVLRATVVERAEQWRKGFEALKTPCGEKALQATLSLGIAVYPEDGETAEVLIREAHQARNIARASGGNRAAATPSP